MRGKKLIGLNTVLCQCDGRDEKGWVLTISQNHCLGLPGEQAGFSRYSRIPYTFHGQLLRKLTYFKYHIRVQEIIFQYWHIKAIFLLAVLGPLIIITVRKFLKSALQTNKNLPEKHKTKMLGKQMLTTGSNGNTVI